MVAKLVTFTAILVTKLFFLLAMATKTIAAWSTRAVFTNNYRHTCTAKTIYKTRGTFRQVPTRQIRLSFVKCAYSDLRDIFFHNFRGLKWIPL